jgi:hypothetical protein
MFFMTSTEKIIALSVVAALGFLIFVWQFLAFVKQKARVKDAIPAQATVEALRVWQDLGKVRVRLQLLVSPPSGIPYETSVEWEVSAANLAQVQEGMQIAVKIDADNPLRVYPGVSWARLDGISYADAPGDETPESGAS